MFDIPILHKFAGCSKRRLDVSREWQYKRYVPPPDIYKTSLSGIGIWFYFLDNKWAISGLVFNYGLSLGCVSPLTKTVKFCILKLIYKLDFYFINDLLQLTTYSRDRIYAFACPLTWPEKESFHLVNRNAINLCNHILWSDPFLITGIKLNDSDKIWLLVTKHI